ncbi:double-strand break repair helicase AddA [Sphingorhabdus sp.]|jgi:ATP-dependent helicase/nuclease subunit A|uniref:double-strand break repair helicase AddA n=5 Tax=Sphingorhabdus sp. TaxID=1902408 RepID=UPI003BB021D6|nr:double-strand break repair helicase AddA [Sphingomonadales bacterium]
MSDPEPKKVHQLTNAQQAAVEPADNIWLSASAGSGKTQVLSARVIRLMLSPQVRPENLLCLTFTKAAAAEMADRINRKLASWVQMKDGDLAAELRAIGADYSKQKLPAARKLFAEVLDAPGGGLQIMTIHSFCQSLLESFPEEAGLLPGFEAIEGRAKDKLLSDTLAELLSDAPAEEPDGLIAKIQQLSLDMGEAGAFAFLCRCADRPAVLRSLPDGQGMLVAAQRIVGLSLDTDIETALAALCSDDVIDRTLISQIAQSNRAWNTSTGTKRADQIAIWLSRDPENRAATLDDLHLCWSTKSGTLAQQYDKKDPSYLRLAQEAFDWTTSLVEMRILAKYAERLASALIAGKAFAARFERAKHERGLVDFDDLISNAAALLSRPGMGEWVRYKLDQRIDHILVDEAQDTNAAQWDIIKALTADYYSGLAAKEGRPRTLFAVGDYKQAIYGFQGTDPERYEEAGNDFKERIANGDSELKRLTLAQSFRSTRPILDFVNAVIDGLGPAVLGINGDIAQHFSELPDIGSISLMKLVSPKQFDSDGEGDDDADENWLSEEKLVLADRIANHVRELIDHSPYLASKKRRLVPGDILILLRKRTDLAGLIVARLHALNVPVAGIDRLQISEPIAVQDLLAAIRFALQPDDDLSLSALLVSPLIGWSQQDLLDYGYRPKGEPLWKHLREQDALAADLAPLHAILASVDFSTPYAFLEQILSGPTQGRRKLQGRLGSETLVPVEELLNQTLQFQQEGGVSLQGFLDWFEKGSTIIKREGLAQSSDVRVMTVHGAKGLEAPVVILADIAVDPLKSGDRSSGMDLLSDDDVRFPLLPIRNHERVGQLAEAPERQKKRELKEQFRLLYVALTRAAEHLILAGSLGARAKGKACENSWYPALATAMQQMGCEWQNDPLWGEVMRIEGYGKAQEEGSTSVSVHAGFDAESEPQWLRTAAPQEQTPPRPLSPSNLDDDSYGDPPSSGHMKLAAERGRLLHGLFERFVGGDLEPFKADALRWVTDNRRDFAIDAASIVETALTVIENSEWQMWFSYTAKPEVPIAATVGQAVISGRIDRLLIEGECVRLLDFKTSRSVPVSAATVPLPYLRQMAHYVAALETIFPSHKIEAALLFTHAPKLIELPAELLKPHRPAI